MNNLDYLEYSKIHKEEMFDPFYTKNKLVISRNGEENTLVKNNRKLNELISNFKELTGVNQTLQNKEIACIVEKIVDILTITPNINYSAFCQFFMVHNSTYSYFLKLSPVEKTTFVYEMLVRFCNERYDLYNSMGYSDIALQIVCDSYAHKRKSKSSIEKVISLLLNVYPLTRLKDINDSHQDNYYFLPDKGDKKLFNAFLEKYNIAMQSRLIEQDKYPDIVFKHNGHIYICELKTMKGVGGGQNKQIVEVAYFIKFSETTPNIHYLTFLDSDYANTLFSDTSAKVTAQRNDIISALHNNPNNFFVNTEGFKKLIENIFSE